jgi:hypothetical protein
LTIPGSESKQEMLEKVVDLAEQIQEEKQRIPQILADKKPP